MAHLLKRFLRQSLSQSFVWGECDCALWACSWVSLKRGVDPAASWRGVCTGRFSAARIIRRGGGLAAICREAFGAAGLSETANPQPGDVGIIATPVGEAVVIRTANGWAWKAARGIAIVPAHHLIAWKV